MAAWGRRAFVCLMLVVVIAGVTGLLGVHTSTTTASGGDTTLSLRYARIARAGQDVPWQVTVTRVGGFKGPVTLAVTGSYFDIFESQGFEPQPSTETRSGGTLYMSFDPPPGDTLQVAYDAYIQPSSQQGRSGRLSVLENGRPIATTHFTTTLMP